MYKIAGLLLFMMVLMSPGRSLAYRPFVTEDAGVAGKGVAQLEMSWDYFRWENRDKEHIFLMVPIYGITERIELSVEIPYMLHIPSEGSDENGIGDVNLVGKFLLLEERGPRPSVALKGVIKTKTGDEDKGLGSGDMDYSIVAAASKSLGDFTLHAMLGYTFIGDNGDDNIRNIYLYGIAADYALTDRLHLVGEVAGSRHPDKNVGSEVAAGLLGATYKLSEKVTFDGAVRRGFNDAVPKWSTTVGLTWTF